MHTITFYSYKGGVGRSLVVANVANYLARMGRTVFLLDFDLEAPGLHYKFGLEHGGALKVKQGLVDILYQFSTNRSLPETLSEYVIDIESNFSSSGKIHLISAGNAPSPDYWKKLSKVDWHALFYSEAAYGIPLFLELKAFIEEAYDPDVVLIDARTGITEMGGVATTVLSNQVVCLMLPTSEHLEGTRGVMHAIRNAPRIEGGSELEIVAVLSRLPQKKDADETVDVAKVKNFLNEPIDALGSRLSIADILVLHRDPKLEEREHILIGSNRRLNDSPLLRDYVRLCVKLIPDSEIENSIGRVIEVIQKRTFHEPDEAEKAIEDLCTYNPHPEAYRALLDMYRLRRRNFSKRLEAAHALWNLTGDARDKRLWEAIQDYRFDREKSLDEDLLNLIELIWRSHGSKDPKFGMAIVHSYEAAGLYAQALGVLDTLVSIHEPTPDAVVKFINLLLQEGQRSRAEEQIERFKAHMSTSPRFLETWTETVLASESTNKIAALVADPLFKLDVLAQHRPVLAARVRVFTGEYESANETFASTRIVSGLSRKEVVQLGALARDLNKLDTFETRLSKASTPAATKDILQSIREIPPLPVPDDFGTGYGGNDDDDIPF
ncbi:tyrosine-protein kinase family protein [Sorangium sp. So ce362]|uniref:tyrosine-protein kinase family protein n=1 Tax=Sorangium sp. So ce362 TaxID=3133303 RepID=UPI003F60ACBC